MATKTKVPPMLTFPPDLWRVDAQRHRAQQAVHDAETRLELALKVNEDADREREVLASKGVNVDELPTAAEAYEHGMGHTGAREVSYYRARRSDAETLRGLEDNVSRAREHLAELEALLVEIREAGKTHDVGAACQAAGSKWYARREVGISGHRYYPNEPIPLPVWAGLTDRERDRLQTTRAVGELPWL